ncbi:hypothetical protein TNCV_1953441 [Trichonephila clavipes]|nr:hypothetical protein TNCV_1953441 [Trichonephila clavipes]
MPFELRNAPATFQRLMDQFHIARPLSNLSKKSTVWKWSEIEQQAFQTLKQCLITPPILRQVDPKKPFIIRTDASSYALGAVLLQGESPTDEQPVEYASRLLSSAEKNYSTTEQEALAVVWALKKFRGFEEAQLVVPTHEREKILKLHHDVPTAAHYGADGTFSRISSKYYWTGMRKFIADYVKSCSECIKYKTTNQKPAGLLQTPVPAQRFESIAIDLFGPLPETTEGMKWIFIVEDYTTKWVELFPLKQATAKECAMTLLNEVFLRYGVPHRLISDNGTQFVSAVMQQLCFVLDINQILIPVYHPQANPVERKNRDLKPRLAMMVGNNHTLWIEKLPAIRFALNTSKCESTDHTAAYLTFARELRTLDQVNTDLRSVIHNNNFVPEFTPYLKRFEGYMSQIKENIQMRKDRQNTYADKSRRPSPNCKVNDLVWVKLHPLSKASQNRNAKLMPRRDGPFIVLSQRSHPTFEVASCDKPDEPLGV